MNNPTSSYHWLSSPTSPDAQTPHSSIRMTHPTFNQVQLSLVGWLAYLILSHANLAKQDKGSGNSNTAMLLLP